MNSTLCHTLNYINSHTIKPEGLTRLHLPLLGGAKRRVCSPDADSEGWSTVLVKKWLQTDFSPSSLVRSLFGPGSPEE